MSVFLADQPDPGAILAALDRETVKRALLLEMRFASETVRISDWAVPFQDGRWGHDWVAGRGLVSMADVDLGEDDLAPLREYSLGIPWEYLTEGQRGSIGMLPPLIGNRPEYAGRDCILMMQLFEGVDVHGRAAPLGYPVALDWSLMDRVSASFGLERITLTLGCESLLARKGAPQYGLLTHRDQLRRHPGDNGLRFVPEVMSTNPVWTTW
jgi:hypothetical protein